MEPYEEATTYAFKILALQVAYGFFWVFILFLYSAAIQFSTKNFHEVKPQYWSKVSKLISSWYGSLIAFSIHACLSSGFRWSGMNLARRRGCGWLNVTGKKMGHRVWGSFTIDSVVRGAHLIPIYRGFCSSSYHLCQFFRLLFSLLC